ncbi:hypothetical protein BDN72DRAFT_865278, partial [Pluteus cervinus]
MNSSTQQRKRKASKPPTVKFGTAPPGDYPVKRFDPFTAQTKVESKGARPRARPKRKGKERDESDAEIEQEISHEDHRLWVDIYEPTTEAELAIHVKKVEDIRWLLEAFDGGPGPAGAGKMTTSRARHIISDAGLRDEAGLNPVAPTLTQERFKLSFPDTVYITAMHLGRFKTIVVAVGIAMLGHIRLIVWSLPGIMAEKSAVGASLVAFITMGFGTGLFKANISPLVAEQYQRIRLFVKTTQTDEHVMLIHLHQRWPRCTWYASRSSYQYPHLGAVVGQLAMTYAEKYVGFWSPFALSTIITVLYFGRSKPNPAMWQSRRARNHLTINGSTKSEEGSGLAVYSPGTHYIINPCENSASTCTDEEENPLVSHLNVWIQSGAYILIAFSEIFASITGLEYTFTKGPKNLRSLARSVFLFTLALASALGEALVGRCCYLWTSFMLSSTVAVVEDGFLTARTFSAGMRMKEFPEADEEQDRYIKRNVEPNQRLSAQGNRNRTYNSSVRFASILEPLAFILQSLDWVELLPSLHFSALLLQSTLCDDCIRGVRHEGTPEGIMESGKILEAFLA